MEIRIILTCISDLISLAERRPTVSYNNNRPLSVGGHHFEIDKTFSTNKPESLESNKYYTSVEDSGFWRSFTLVRTINVMMRNRAKCYLALIGWSSGQQINTSPYTMMLADKKRLERNSIPKNHHSL